MKRLSLLIFSIFCFFVLFANYFCNKQKPEDILFKKIIIQTNNKLSKRYNLVFSSIGESAKNGKISEVTIDFNRFQGPISKNEGRKMIIDCVEEYVKAINKRKSLKPFLTDNSFTEKNVAIMITHWNKDKTKIFHPDINTFTKFSSGLFYYTADPERMYRDKTESKETYEEALSIVKQSNNPIINHD